MSLYFVVSRRSEKFHLCVMANVCTDCSNQVQLAIYVRYIYKDNFQKMYRVTEDFCGFVKQKPTDAETSSRSLLVNLRNCCFDLTKLRGQWYDGCSTMSDEVSGVKTCFPEELSNTKYFVHL